MKKVVKKQLKEDEFVSTVSKVVRFIKEQKTELLIFLTFVCVIILALIGIRYWRAQHLKKESQVVSQMLTLRADLDKNPRDLAKLEKMAGNNKFSRISYILLATYWVENGNPDKAESALGQIKDQPKDFFYYQAQDLMAQVYVQRKNYDKAIEVYNRIEKDKPKAYSLDVILYHRAEALEKRGDRTGALAVYKKVQEGYPQTYFGYDASLKARKLEGKK